MQLHTHPGHIPSIPCETLDYTFLRGGKRHHHCLNLQPNHSNPTRSLPLKLDLESLRLDGPHNAILVKLHIEGVGSSVVVDGRVGEIPRIFELRPRVLFVGQTLGQEQSAESVPDGTVLSGPLEIGRVEACVGGADEGRVFEIRAVADPFCDYYARARVDG